jgi:hypothetical protein
MKNQPSSTSMKNPNAMSYKKSIKGLYLILSSLFISLISLPFAFAKSTTHRLFSHPVISTTPNVDSSKSMFSVKSVYDSLQLNMAGLSRQAFEYAQKGWQKLIDQGRVFNQSIIAIVDFSQPSTNKRLYVIDMENYKVLFNTLVSHGKNSGKEMASTFSNRPSSYMSSPGFYITGQTYNGENGYSLRLDGVEKGINDKAFERAIVMHGADYVNENMAAKQGYIGRSWGCPAVPREHAIPIINTLKNGACLFIYAPPAKYQSALVAA